MRGTEKLHALSWSIPALFFDQNYRIASKANGRFAFESFSFANNDETNTAEIVWDMAFGVPAWVMRSRAEPRETRFYSREDVSLPSEVRIWKYLPNALAVDNAVEAAIVTVNEIEIHRPVCIPHYLTWHDNWTGNNVGTSCELELQNFFFCHKDFLIMSESVGF